MATEVNRIFPDWPHELKWQVYLAVQELVKATLCLLLMRWVTPRLTPTMFLAAVWFTTQAHQEFTGNNDGTTQMWEYNLVALMALVISLQLTLTRK